MWSTSKGANAIYSHGSRHLHVNKASSMAFFSKSAIAKMSRVNFPSWLQKCLFQREEMKSHKTLITSPSFLPFPLQPPLLDKGAFPLLLEFDFSFFPPARRGHRTDVPCTNSCYLTIFQTLEIGEPGAFPI